MWTSNIKAPSGTNETPKGIERADPTAGFSSHARAHNPKLRERPETKEKAWPQYNVDRVCEPQHAHRDRRITSAAEDCVHHEQHYNCRVTCQHDSGEARAVLNNPRRPAHQLKQPGRERRPNGSNDCRHD